MATALKQMRPVVAVDDGVRERHGVASTESYVDVYEDSGGLWVSIPGKYQTNTVWLTPAKARYLASRLRRLARRIEQREAA